MGDQEDGLKEAFDAIASRYDAERRWIIPDFPGFYASAVRAAASPKPAPSVLDVGAGTGLLSEMLLAVYPAAIVTLMDFSEKMLAVARERFRGKESVRFMAADYREADSAARTISSARPSPSTISRTGGNGTSTTGSSLPSLPAVSS